MTTIPTASPNEPDRNEPGPDDVTRGLSEIDAYLTHGGPAPAPDPHGYTRRVAQREAQVAEADRLADLPTDTVLAREAQLAEERRLAVLDTRALVARLHDEGERERAGLHARAQSATARRVLDTNPHVRALTLARRRTARVGMLWAVLGLALAYTAVNVQKFAAGGVGVTDPRWWVAWGVDPVLSALVVALLLTKGDLAGVRVAESRWARRSVWGVEIGALLAQLLMNVAPAVPGAWQVIALHVVIPLAAVAAALALPVVQRRYAVAITALDTAPTGPTAAPTGREYRPNTPAPTGGEGPSTAALVARARELITSGALPPDPSATALRSALRVGTDFARAVRDALKEGA
jgi:hypothetical protein